MKQIARVALATVMAIVAVFLLLTLAQTVRADPPVSWTVSTTGSDHTGCGAETDACQTIAYAIGEAVDGATIILTPGTYTQNGTLVIDKAITLVARDGVGSAVVAGNGAIGRVILIENDDVTLAELEVRIGTGDVIRQSDPYTGTVITGTVVHQCGDECIQLSNCTNCAIENVTVYDAAQDGLSIADNSHSSVIRNNEIYNSQSENGVIYIYGSSAITVEGNYLHDNGAANGIKIYDMSDRGSSIIRHNRIDDNIFVGRKYDQDGNAVQLYKPFKQPNVDAHLIIQGNVISNNSGTGQSGSAAGHGIFWYQYEPAPPPVLVEGNRIRGNGGSAIFLDAAVPVTATVRGNLVTGNGRQSSLGGGIYVRDAAPLISHNVINANQAAFGGGGVYIEGADGARLINNIIAGNTLGEPIAKGAGLNLVDSTAHLLHNTLAENQGGDGAGLHVGAGSTAALTNTIVVSHAVGVTITSGSSASLQTTLWYGNGVDIDGDGTVVSHTHVYGPPAFFGGGDYHIQTHSAAVDAGGYVGVDDDVDGTLRPRLYGYDIGADEAPNVDTVALTASPSSILANGLTTATLTGTASYRGLAQDDVAIVFTSTLGIFPNSLHTITVTTTQGAAVTWLRSVPASRPLTSTVRASAYGASAETQVGFTAGSCQQDLTTWTEAAANPVFDPDQKVYYPTVIYDATAFGHSQGDVISSGWPFTYVVAPFYKMWTARSNANQGLQFDYSADGLTWHQFAAGAQLPGLAAKGYHSRVLYDANAFGATGFRYKIWYWDPDANLYDITAIRTADSVDGLVWTNDVAVSQSPTQPLVTGAGSGWNRGTYGPVDLLFNPSAANSGPHPFDYSFVMYYDATTGGSEQVGLAYSADGVTWTRYGDNPVLAAGDGAGGEPTPWDNGYVGMGTVLKDSGGVYHFWYSGGTTALHHGIGYAVSPDGIHWVKSENNPIFHIDDGVAWRGSRTYTPVVLYSAARFDGHGTPEQYKMWFTGDDGSERTIGYATLKPVSLSLADTSGSGQDGQADATLDQPFVVGVRDICGDPAAGVRVAYTVSGAPAGASGQSLSLDNGVTGPAGQVSSTLTLGSMVGTYTVTANATGVLGMPAVFTATASHDLAMAVRVDPDPQTITAGDRITYTVSATDAHGNAWDATDAAAYAAPAGAGGSWAANVYVSEIAGTWTVTATVDGTSGSAGLTVLPGAPSQITVDPIPDQVMGIPFTINLAVRDLLGNVVTGFGGTADLADSTGTISPAETGAFLDGVWSGPVSIDVEASDVVITATSGLLAGFSNPFDVAAAAAVPPRVYMYIPIVAKH